MAARNRSNGIADDTVELEAMRKDDSSWHPCQVSLSSNGVGLIVDYGNTYSEDIMANEKEAIARLRIRSIPLHGDDCLHIQEGEHVLATPMSQSKRLFFDAEVEKALRIRHSKKVHCRCTFMIKWLHQDLKGGTLTIPSSSVMKLATKSIDVHPTISAFLSTLKSLHCFSTSPLPTTVDDMDSEIDLHELLEKQIEAISSSADVSKKRISDNTLLGVEVDKKGKNQRGVVAGSKLSKLHVQLPPDHNHLKRTTRSTQKLQIEMEVKDPSSTAPSIQEELLQSRSLLNPLAARAALASLMSKVPQNLEVSIYHEEKLDYTYSLDNITCKLDILQSLNGTKSYNSPTGNSFSKTDELYLQAAATSVPFDRGTNKDVKLLISANSVSGKTQLLDSSSVMLTQERESESKTSEIPYSRENFTCSVAKRKLNQPPKATKTTRSAKEKRAGITDDTVKMKTRVEQKGQSSTKVRRFTRSALCEVKETQTMEAKQGMEEYKSGKYADTDYANQSIAASESYALEDEKSVTSRNSSAVELLYTQERNNPRKEEQVNKTRKVEKKTRVGLRNSTSLSRFTCSAVNENEGNKIIKATNGLGEDGCEIMVLKTTEWTSSPLDAEGDLSPTEERHNGGKMSSAVNTTVKTEGEVAGNRESSRSLKRKCTSNKQELRSSPRLRFLPRTRSHNKS